VAAAVENARGADVLLMWEDPCACQMEHSDKDQNK